VGDFGDMGDYLPMNSADGLLTFPANSFKKIMASNLPTNRTEIVFALALAYIVLFIFWSRNRYMKKDL
jgi:hypothetical protein